MADDILDYELLGGIYRRRFESAFLVKRKAARIFDFFGLPREIRNMIYGNLHTAVELPILKQVCRLESARLEIAPIKSLLLINRQFNQEYCEELPLHPAYNKLIVDKLHEHDEDIPARSEDSGPVTFGNAMKLLDQQGGITIVNLSKRLTKVTELTFSLHLERRSGNKCWTTRNSIHVLRECFLTNLKNLSLHIHYEEEPAPETMLTASMLDSYAHYLLNDPLTHDYPSGLKITPTIETEIYRLTMPTAGTRFAYKDWSDYHYHNLEMCIWSSASSKCRFIGKLAGDPDQNPDHLFNGLSFSLEEKDGGRWSFDEMEEFYEPLARDDEPPQNWHI